MDTGVGKDWNGLEVGITHKHLYIMTGMSGNVYNLVGKMGTYIQKDYSGLKCL